MVCLEFEKIPPKQRQIVEKHLKNFPVKIGTLAKELGVAVKISSLKTGISGQIACENGEYVIKVNRNEAKQRQRFTIGHELAHFLLHKPLIDSSPDGIRDTILYRSGASDNVEYEANRLAADILMPEPKIKEVLNNNLNNIINEASIEELASNFEVSKAAMEIRLSHIKPTA